MNDERHSVKRAVIMAAGIGKRMNPVTLETPKPLVKVNGVRMIDTVVDGLKINGITEIYVVVGYRKEQFIEWAKNREVRIIENPFYDSCNNIASLYVARNYLEDCMILDGDQMIYRPEVLSPEFARSGYNAVWCEGQTNEWLMDVEDGIVKECHRNGGAHGWQLYSISRWTADDGKKLKAQVVAEFERGNRQIYWDDIPMFCYFDDYTMGIMEMHRGDVVEIDGYDELLSMDNSYRGIGRR